MGRATSNFFWPATWGPGEGSKGQISFNFNYKVNFKDFYTKLCVCVLTNERYKTYQTGFSFCPLGHAPGVGLWGAGDAQGVKKISNMVMWYVKSTRMTSRTECKYNFHPRVKLVTLEQGQRSNIIKFWLPC